MDGVRYLNRETCLAQGRGVSLTCCRNCVICLKIGMIAQFRISEPGNASKVTVAFPRLTVTHLVRSVSYTALKDGARGAVDQPYLCAMITGLGVKITSHTLNSSDGLFVADAAADGADLTTSM
jgi:hypothetical protein